MTPAYTCVGLNERKLIDAEAVRICAAAVCGLVAGQLQLFGGGSYTPPDHLSVTMTPPLISIAADVVAAVCGNGQ